MHRTRDRYGLHLLHRQIAFNVVRSAQKSRVRPVVYGLHLLSAQKSREWTAFIWHDFRGSTACINYSTTCINLLARKSRQYGAFNCWYDFLGCKVCNLLAQKTRVYGCFAKHKFPDFGIKSVVEISSIFTVFLSYIFAEEIINLSSLWLVFPVGVFPGLISQKSLSQIYGVTVYVFISAC